MKATQAPEQHEPSVKEPFTMYLAVSVAVHGLAIVGMLGSVLWWGKPTYYKPRHILYRWSMRHCRSNNQRRLAAGEKADKRPEVARRRHRPAPRPERR